MRLNDNDGAAYAVGRRERDVNFDLRTLGGQTPCPKVGPHPLGTGITGRVNWHDIEISAMNSARRRSPFPLPLRFQQA
jgi:hypothetical protein